jgi:glycosyltransferase involved in cell wall biosynthesis
MKVIGIYTGSVNHFIETVIYWLTYDHEIKVLLVTPSGFQKGEHPYCLKRICQYSIEREVSQIEIVEPDSPPQSVDYLYISLSRSSSLMSRPLNRWVLKSHNIGLLSYSNYRSLKQSFKELAYNFPYYLAARSIFFQISSQDRHPYFFIQQKLFYSPSVHPQLITISEHRNLIFESKVDFQRIRSFEFIFLGSREPIERTQVLSSVKQTLNAIADPVYFLDYSDPSPPVFPDRSNVLWIEYGSEGSRRGLKPPEYIDALQQSNFCICPLGWGGNWTHRVIEAIACGSIPILEDEGRYNIDLAHMENCIVVKNKDWQTAIEQACRLSAEEATAMRLRLKQLKEQYLLPQKASCRLKELMP